MHILILKKNRNKILSETRVKMILGLSIFFHPTNVQDGCHKLKEEISLSRAPDKLRICVFYAVKTHVLSDQSVHIMHTYCCVSKLSKF
jgi:hypothetical protein